MALVAFLKGINVGGHRTFRPAVLAAQLRHLGVVNVGAAGTFVVTRPTTRQSLRAELNRRLPFEVDVAICEGREIVRLLEQNPFSGQRVQPHVVRFVSVLARRPRVVPRMPMAMPSSAQWLLKVLAVEKHFVFGLYRRRMKTIGYLRTLDRLFGVPVTTRTMTTMARIARLLRATTPRRPPARRQASTRASQCSRPVERGRNDES